MSEPDDAASEPDDAELVSWWGLVLEGFSVTMRRVAADVEAQCGLSQAPAEVMLRLGRTPGGRLPMSRIASESSLSSGGLTKVADKLVGLGHARRVPASDDRRVVYIELTRQGQALADRIEQRTADVLRATMLAVLGAEDARRLGQTMRRLRDAD